MRIFLGDDVAGGGGREPEHGHPRGQRVPRLLTLQITVLIMIAIFDPNSVIGKKKLLILMLNVKCPKTTNLVNLLSPTTNLVNLMGPTTNLSLGNLMNPTTNLDNLMSPTSNLDNLVSPTTNMDNLLVLQLT